MKTSYTFSFILRAGLFFTVLFYFSGAHQAILAQQFEGTLTYKLEADGDTQNLTYFMKENKARVEIAIEQLGGNVVMLLDSESENLTILMEQMEMYMQIPIPRSVDDREYDEAEDFHLTGEKQTIAGVVCRQYVFTDDGGNETEIWTPADQDFGRFLFPGMSGDNMGTMKQPDMPQFSFFPFLLVSSGSDGLMRLEVTSVESKNLNNTIFAVPSNFREMNMPLFGN